MKHLHKKLKKLRVGHGGEETPQGRKSEEASGAGEEGLEGRTGSSRDKSQRGDAERTAGHAEQWRLE